MLTNDDIAAKDLGVIASIRSDRWTRLFFVLAVVAFAFSVAFGVISFYATHSAKWNPLGPYPQQVVTNVNHVVPVNGTVNIIALKCSKFDGIVVHASGEWIPVNHPEDFVSGGAGQTVRFKSCGPTPSASSFNFHLHLPSKVVADVTDKDYRIWRLTGYETPINSHGKRGVPRAWTTDTFSIK